MTRIHVNTTRIGANANSGARQPPLKIQQGDGPEMHCHQVEIQGPCRVVYRPDAPLPDGARVWIETEAPVLTMGLEEE